MSGRVVRHLEARTRAFGSAGDTLAAEVLGGLLAERKTLPPKLFYDAVGADLFERITRLPEYYPTRAELKILDERATDIANLAGPAVALLEYGSGAGVKVRRLLDVLRAPHAYIPIDISAEQLDRVARGIAAEYPKLAVHPVCADYTRPFRLPTLPAAARRVAFFPGSTIGNFHPTEAAAFLRRVRRAVEKDGGLILGVDRPKARPILNAAYNDAAGVTAAFNLNVLRRLNRELNATFDVNAFAHRAFFNAEASRIEMHLVSLDAQTVTIAGRQIPFEAGETIWTESSYKYDRGRLEQLALSAGFAVHCLWTDTADLFWIGYLIAD